ncbi:MAG: hypothetical protein ABIF11_00985 [Nitrospirota bacterium]
MPEVLLKSKEDVIPLIKSAFNLEIKTIETGIERTVNKLTEFERKYGMRSEDFYQKAENGKLEDSLEYIEWAGEVETLNRLKDDLFGLKGIEICT